MAGRHSSRRGGSPPSPPSLDSSTSSLEQCTSNPAPPRVSVSHPAGNTKAEVALLQGEKLEAAYQDIAYLCPFSR